MGIVIELPTVRYGGVTRSTEQPHAVERLAAWIRRGAHMRASASLGCEATLEQAPNIVPMRHRTRLDAVAAAVTNHCHKRGYPGRVVSDAIRVGLMRLREGRTTDEAIESAKTRADFAVMFGKPQPPKGAA